MKSLMHQNALAHYLDKVETTKSTEAGTCISIIFFVQHGVVPICCVVGWSLPTQ